MKIILFPQKFLSVNVHQSGIFCNVVILFPAEHPVFWNRISPFLCPSTASAHHLCGATAEKMETAVNPQSPTQVDFFQLCYLCYCF